LGSSVAARRAQQGARHRRSCNSSNAHCGIQRGSETERDLDRFFVNLKLSSYPKVDDRPRDSSDPVVSPSAEAIVFELVPEHSSTCIFDWGELVEPAARQPAIEAPLTLVSQPASRRDTSSDHSTRFARLVAQQLFNPGPMNVDTEIEPVEQRPGQPTDVTLEMGIVACAGTWRPSPARTRVHCSDEQEVSGELNMDSGPRHRDVAIFQRLPHIVENLGRELGDFVHKENATMCHRHLARPHSA
jgi:hypothetical protein